MWVLKLFLLLLLAAVAALAVMNAEPVSLYFYFGSRDISLSVILAAAFGAGGLLGALASLGMVLGVQRENTRLRRRLSLTEQEVSNLRILPLQDR